MKKIILILSLLLYAVPAFAVNSISGNVGAENVYVVLGGAATATTVTDFAGAYSFTGLSAGNYIVTCQFAGFYFSPNSISVTIVSTDVTGINFGAGPESVPVSTWTRQGPVLPATTGTGSGALEPTVIYEGNAQILSPNLDGKIFKMWYTFWPMGGGTMIDYAESNDGKAWTAYSGNPVLNTYTAGKVFKNASTYYLYASPGGGNDTSVDAYTSSDGLSWTLGKTGALTLGSAGSWDDGQVYGIRPVYISGGTWHAVYSGDRSGGVLLTGVATSTDGLTWTKYVSNPVLFNLVSPYVIQVGSTFWAWGDKTIFGQAGAGNYQFPTDVSRSSSLDLITWTTPTDSIYRSTPAEGMGVANSQIDSPTLLELNGVTYMWYGAGNDASTGTVWNIYLDTFNGTVAQLTLRETEGINSPPIFVQGMQASNMGVGNNAIAVMPLVDPPRAAIFVEGLIFGTGCNFVSLTDSLQNIYTQIGTFSTIPNGAWGIWYTPVSKGGPSSINLGGDVNCTFLDIGVVEYLNVANHVLDAFATPTFSAPSSSTITTPSVSTIFANDFLLALIRPGGVTTATPGAGFTQRLNLSSGFVEMAADGIATTPGSYNTTFSISPNSVNNFATILGIRSINTTNVQRRR